MKVKSILLASVLALAAPVAQADHDGKTYTVFFEESTMVFQCRDKTTLDNLLVDIISEENNAKVIALIADVRKEILPNGNPKCDFLMTPEGKYGSYEQLTEVAPVEVDQIDYDNGVSQRFGVYVIYDVAGDPMYMFLVFPVQNDVAYRGFDYFARLLGVNL